MTAKELENLKIYININGYFCKGRYMVDIGDKAYDVEAVMKTLSLMNV